MRVRLTRKFAGKLNGVDLNGHTIGDVIDLPKHDAEMLIEERWASADDWASPDRIDHPKNSAARRKLKHRA
jgi:hypothetical protein